MDGVSYLRCSPGFSTGATALLYSITELNLSSLSCYVLYADDNLLYHPISRANDFLGVQSDIDAIKADEHILQLNPSKCKYVVHSIIHGIIDKEVPRS